MKPIFVDSSAWIAMNSKRDVFYSKAVSINKELLQKGHHYVTTNFVLDETYTALMMKIGHFAAVDFGEKIRSSQVVQIIHITPDIEEYAWKLFKQYSDKEFSFTDCTSFAAMRQMSLTEAFTNDHHFKQMGFRILLE